MTRIFFALALFAVLLLVANLILGLTKGDFGAASRQYQSAFHAHREAAESPTSEEVLQQATQDRTDATAALQQQRSQFWTHIWLGIVAALVALLVNSISITYFIGTNRWSCEVVEAFSLDRRFAERSQRLKREAFPWSLLAIVLILCIAGLGAAADPVALGPGAADWVELHWGLAMIGTLMVACSLFKQVAVIGKNYELIQEILAAAEAERERRKRVLQTASQPTSPGVEG